MAVNTTTGTFSQAIDAAVRALFDKAKDEQSARLYGTQIGWGMEEVDVPEAQISELSGPGRGGVTVEGQAYATVQRYKGYPMTLALRKYSLDLQYTEEDIHWISKQSSSKKRSTLTSAANGTVQGLNQNINEDSSKVFYLGFGTTFLTGGNSEALFAAHTIRKTGSTQLNTFASGATYRPFGPDALSDALTVLNRLKSHNDIELLPVRRARVLCSKELAPDVIQTLESQYGPNNGNLGLNVGSKEFMTRRGISIDHMVLADMPYAYRDYWFVLDLDRMEESCFFAYAWLPRLSDQADHSKGVFSRLGSTVFGFYWTNPTWCFGSKGDSSTI